MRRQAIGLVLLTALAIPAWADDKAAEDEKLIGTWILQSVEMGPNKESLLEGGVTFVFSKGGKTTRKLKDLVDKEGTFTVAVSKEPKEIDLIGPKKEGKKQEITKAIYKIDGDTLIMAIPATEPDGERPTAFDSKRAFVYTLKRQKP
jgi:uncharacterized protein (TIGR03067 family)